MKEKRKSQFNIRYAGLSFLPLIISIILTIVAFFASFMITMISGGRGVAESGDTIVNEGIFNIIRYTLFIIIFGWWYATLTSNDDVKDILEKRILNHFKRITSNKKRMGVILAMLLVIGLGLQFMVSAIIGLLNHLFPELFVHYNELIESITSNQSIIYIISVVLFAPIAEEILFRGVILKYAEQAFPAYPAIFVSALLFGLYYGNLIQGTYAVAIGFLMGVLVMKTDSILPSMFLHFIINLSEYLIPDSVYSRTVPCVVIIVISAIISGVVIVALIRKFNKTVNVL